MPMIQVTMSFRFPIFLIILLFARLSTGNDCLGWFINSGLASKSSECELKCAVTPVDMDTFSCTNDCQQLCSKDLSEQILNYVPRLTEGDRIVIAKMPYQAYKVFLAKEKINKLAGNIFKKTQRKDESDAFRHFVWSCWLAEEIGLEKAKIFLMAHEQDSTQSKAEKEMDLYNNEQGLLYFKEYKKKSKGRPLELDKIEGEALNRLRAKKLKILVSRFEKIPGGYYSK